MVRQELRDQGQEDRIPPPKLLVATSQENNQENNQENRQSRSLGCAFEETWIPTFWTWSASHRRSTR